MPEDEQSQGGLSGAVKKTKDPVKPGGPKKAKSSAREERLAEALRENLRRRKAPKQQKDTKED